MIRRLAATLAAVAMLLLLAVPVMAGGWADIVADGQTTKPPVEGKPIEIGFKVMQHGVTPAPWETATVHFLNAASGDKIDVAAKSDGEDGHFSATVTLPHTGYWSWTVSLQNLESVQSPVTIAVRSRTGQLPPFDPATAMTAIERAKSEVRTELSNTLGAELERIDGNANAVSSRLSSLDSQVSILTKERDALQARIESLESGGGLPIFALISLAALAGAAAGLAMSWLSARSGPSPKVTLSPTPATPRGADPA